MKRPSTATRRRRGAARPAELGLWRQLGPFLRPHRGALWGSVALAIGGQTLLAMVPLLQKVIVDDAIVAGTRPLGPWIALLLGISVVGFTAHTVRRYLGMRLGIDVQHDLRVAVHHQVHRLDAARHDRLNNGDVLSRALADTNLVQLFLAQVALLVANVTLVAAGLVVMLFLSPVLFAVVAATLPPLGYVGFRLRQRAFPASWYDQHLTGVLTSAAEEAVVGVRVVKAFGQEGREVEGYVARATALFGSRMRSARISARYGTMLQAIPSVGQLGVLVVGGWLALRGDLTIGVFLAFASYLVQLVVPVRLMAAMVATTQQARAGMRRVVELLETEPAIAEDPAATELAEPDGGVTLEGVRFAHDGVPALRGVDLRIEPGEALAIVGAAGSGKSTLALLLSRVYDPDGGSVRIGGTDLRDATLASVRGAVAHVAEDPFLFSGTIEDNIAFGRPDASTEEVRAAARLARADEFVERLPDGYATLVGERGATLSGGQRQRLALARALLVEAPILVLDDATSAIDVRTEEAIFTDPAFTRVGRTTVIVARRPSTVRLADRVAVLDRGRVVAVGTDSELRASSPLYRMLLVGPEDDDTGLGHGTTRAERSGHAEHLDGGWSVPDPEAWPAAAVDGHAEEPVPASAELLEQVRSLPPIVDRPRAGIGLRDADPGFTFRRLLRPFRATLLVLAAMLCVDAAATLAGPLLFRYGIDAGVVDGRGGALALASVIYLGVQVVSWANAWAMQLRASRTAEEVLFDLRARAFGQLQRLSLDYYERSRAGRILTRLTTDVDALAQLVQQGLLLALVSVLTCGGVLVVLVVLDWRLAGAVLVVLPFLLLGTWWFVRRSAEAYRTARSLVSDVNADLQEHLSGVLLTQAHGRSSDLEARFAARSSGLRDARRRSALYICVFFPYLALLSNIAKAIILVLGARLIDEGQLTAGVLVAFLLYADQFFTPLQQLSMAVDQWIQARVSFSRIAELVRTTPSVVEVAQPVELEHVRGDVRFEGVHFAYGPDAPEVLRGVDLHVAAGEVVALVGTTGAGKSTFVKLATRFYDPTAGQVLIDGVPLSAVALGTFRRRVGYVPQEPFLFTGTVRSNIAYGVPHATDADIERAARHVGAHELIRALPGGYHTTIRAGGRSLSAGQRQLLCLARAELLDPAVLVLDEATSNVDMATEAQVQRALGLLARGRTTLLIAHRLRSAALAQRIVVIEDGRPVEDGSHEELIASGGRYAAMWATFARSEGTLSAAGPAAP